MQYQSVFKSKFRYELTWLTTVFSQFFLYDDAGKIIQIQTLTSQCFSLGKTASLERKKALVKRNGAEYLVSYSG